MDAPKVTKSLDVRGRVCPYPVIQTKIELGKMSKGEVLEIITDNLPSVENIPMSAEKGGHKVLDVSKVGDGVYKILVRVQG